MLEETADGENGFQAASTVARQRYRPEAIGRHDDFKDILPTTRLVGGC